MLVSLIVFTALYGALAVVMFGLFKKYAQKGPEPDEHDDAGLKQLAIQY